jgi:hypothetical protein
VFYIAMVNKALLTVLILGLGVVAALAGFSYSATAVAQQMQMPGMTTPSSQQQQAQTHQEAMKHSMFKVDGMSVVENVKISGVSITGDKEVSVNLAYNGNATSPSVTVIAITNHEQMMKDMMGGGSMGSGMGGGSMGGMSGGMGQQSMGQGMTMGNNNNTQSMAMMTMGQENNMQSQTGSSIIIEGGWLSGTTVKVKLDGDGSAFNAQDIHVMVFPHIV